MTAIDHPGSSCLALQLKTQTKAVCAARHLLWHARLVILLILLMLILLVPSLKMKDVKHLSNTLPIRLYRTVLQPGVLWHFRYQQNMKFEFSYLSYTCIWYLYAHKGVLTLLHASSFISCVLQPACIQIYTYILLCCNFHIHNNIYQWTWKICL